MPLRREIVGFAVAGVLGFVVDTAVLYSAMLLGLNFYLGRVVSFLAAATFTWWFNRRHSFAGAASGKPLWLEWLQYLGAMLLGGAVNYGVSAWVYATLPVSTTAPLLGVAAGSLAGLVVNFVSAKFLIFRRGTP